jgi:hypothetical protein
VFGLRISLRCWRDDLKYPGDEPELNSALEDILVRDFARTRRVNPEGQEGVIAALGPPFMKLKAGDRARGVSIWEERPQGRIVEDPDLPFAGVVWLLGRGYRKEGDADDAYREFARIGAERLRPVQVDYELLYAAILEDAIEALRMDLERALKELLEHAWREPGVLHEAVVESYELGLAILVFDNAEYRVLVLPTLGPDKRPIPDQIQESLIRIVFDGKRLDELEYPDAEILAQVGYSPGRLSCS